MFYQNMYVLYEIINVHIYIFLNIYILEICTPPTACINSNSTTNTNNNWTEICMSDGIDFGVGEIYMYRSATVFGYIM